MKIKQFIEILHQMLAEFIETIKNPDPWAEILILFNKRVQIESLHCPVCGESSLSIGYTFYEKDDLKQKRNRKGGAWISCKSCGAGVHWDGVKVPDWYSEANQ